MEPELDNAQRTVPAHRKSGMRLFSPTQPVGKHFDRMVQKSITDQVSTGLRANISVRG